MTNINKGKHTPLPWRTDDSDFDKTGWINIHPEEEISLPLCSVRHYQNEARANAKLIVKACSSHYELLEALKNIVHGYYQGATVFKRNIVAAKEAIKKAEGEIPNED